MTTQLWLTAAVAVAGNVVLLINAMLNSRSAVRLALRVREVDRRDGRRKSYEECCQQFIAAARQLRSPIAAAPNEIATALADTRRAVAGIELYGPPHVHDPVVTALAALENMARVRSDSAWTTAIAEAEASCDAALTTARTALSNDVNSP
ncbi:hypothetical protein GFY24_30180 [Nocardia sp. SYP-A9097]|uniref:hypothetical protein n=1 Tax=Nocardia sp. SYP-A9097 TaxID=2663237 RepID=UPI00129BDC65|nr:hypothetical protein [Nocardia sp. SYP-A9097]MRH91658.1 hypothetical protein [Nocardia sp. SYP-A9097]